MPTLLYQVAAAALAAVVPIRRPAPVGSVRSPNAAGLPQALKKLQGAGALATK